MDLKAHRQPWCIARREHKSREFRVTRIYRRIVVKGFFRDLLSLRTAQAIRSKKIDIRSNSSGYPFKKNGTRSNYSGYPLETTVVRSKGLGYLFKNLSSVRTTGAIRSRKIVIRSNGSRYPFQTIVSRATDPNHFHDITVCDETVENYSK